MGAFGIKIHSYDKYVSKLREERELCSKEAISMNIFIAHCAQTGPSLLPAQYQGWILIHCRHQTEKDF